MGEAVAGLIEARGLTKHYGSTVAVDGIDLSVKPGEVYGLLGPNGAGKTTTILMVLGLTEPDAGTVEVCGLDPARNPLSVKRQVGYLPDAVGFYENMTGRENLDYTARLNEIDAEEADGQIATTLEQVGLSDVADRKVGEYSRGMRQRLGVADALIKDPRVVILDEPTMAIDPEGVAEMRALITRLAHEDGRAVLLSSHLLHQVQQSCDRMAIFVGGRVIAEGTAEELGAALADGRARFEVVTGASESALTGALGGKEAHVDAAGPGRWRISLPVGNAASLLPALVGAGVEVREVRDLGSDLDEIYRRFFAEAEGTAA
jgi:ABC-2 type transport system ATP-binding protein